eukprot:4807979-Pyramimonas_sp.AAC.1
MPAGLTVAALTELGCVAGTGAADAADGADAPAAAAAAASCFSLFFSSCHHITLVSEFYAANSCKWRTFRLSYHNNFIPDQLREPGRVSPTNFSNAICIGKSCIGNPNVPIRSSGRVPFSVEGAHTSPRGPSLRQSFRLSFPF